MNKLLTFRMGDTTLSGELELPENADAFIIFSYGSGNSRFSSRNSYLAHRLQQYRLGTFTFDLLTNVEAISGKHYFNIELLTQRLLHVTHQLLEYPVIREMPLCYFAVSTGAAAAFRAASILGNKITAMVTLNGRPDLTGPYLEHLNIPTLMMVSEGEKELYDLNVFSWEKNPSTGNIQVIKGASLNFEEPEALEQVLELSGEWYHTHAVRKTSQQKAHKSY